MDTPSWFDPYAAGDTLHPVALAMIIVLGTAMLLLPRRHALLPMVIMACFISQAQRVVILGANFNLIRVMVLFGWARIISRGEYSPFKWLTLDKLVMSWAIVRTIIFTIQRAEFGAFVFQLGQSFDSIGMYFMFRCLLRSWDDWYNLDRSFIAVSIPVAACFFVEWQTRHNLFSFLGGVPLITEVREGRLRCQGAFPHPIVAGCFWAVMLPFVIALWWRKDQTSKAWCLVGCFTFCAIIASAGSSTPLGGVLEGVFGMSLFFLRHRMRTVRWSLLAILLLLHIVMKGPVWSLLGHIDLAGGSTGAYRAVLIDLAIHNFDTWWLIGTKSISSWNPWFFDVTDQYIMEAITGGIWTLTLFVAMISFAFRDTGSVIHATENDRAKQIAAWSIGVGLFVHVMTFFGVFYFGQIYMVWYLQLATIGSLAALVSESRRPLVSRVGQANSPMPVRNAKASGMRFRSRRPA